MKITPAQKIKTGIFVAIGFAFLIAIIFLIGKSKNLFSKTFLVHAHFKNVSGLQEGNFVRFAGINVGTVDNISIVNDTTVRIELELNNSIKPYIKTDAVAHIGSDGLMGDKLIQIGSGSDSAGVVKPGGRIKSVNPVEMEKIVGKITRIADNAEALTSNLAGIVAKLNNGEGSLGRLISSDNLAKQLESTVVSAKETVKSVKETSDNANENMKAVKHNFLFRGYFKKKERQRVKDSTAKANAKQNPDSLVIKKKK